MVSGDAGNEAEISQLKRELARVTEERDTLKTVPGGARLCGVETGHAMDGPGGSRPIAYWRHDTPLKNVARGHLRT